MKTFTIIKSNSLDNEKLMVSHVTIEDNDLLSDVLEREKINVNGAVIFEGKHYPIICNDVSHIDNSVNNSVNKGVKEGKTAGIVIGCINDCREVGFLMEEKTSIIQIKDRDFSTQKIEVSSKELLALSRIITNTLK